MIRPICDAILLSFISAVLLLPRISLAQNDSVVTPKVEMLTMRVLVMDADNHPLEGATVTPRGLRTRLERGSHWGWDHGRFGTPPKVTTGIDGIAIVPYPKFVEEKMEVGEVTLVVSHPNFVTLDQDRSVDDDPAEVPLEHGFRVAANAMNAATGEKVEKDLYAVISGFSVEPWKFYDNGTLISPVFKKQTGQMRLMQIIDGTAVLFSDHLPVVPEESSRVFLKDVKLRPGIRLSGRLDDSVPRPVVNGFVSARIARPGIDDNNGWESRWHWMDKTTISPEGDFVFKSLPPGEVAQLIAVCDGHVSKSATQEEVSTHFPTEHGGNGLQTPQLFLLSEDLEKIEIRMEPTTSVRIKVTAPDGSPIANASVAMWPNVYYFYAGTTVLGMSGSSAEALVRQRQGHVSGKATFGLDRFVRKTDEAGLAVIDNLPANRSESVEVTCDDYEMPIAGNRRWTTVDLKANEVAELIIQMQKKGSEQLGVEATDVESGQKEVSSDGG